MERSIDHLKPDLIFRAIKSYFRFVHDRLYYRKIYVLNKENVPANGVPTMIISNHQNCLNDPLGIQFSFRKRKVNIIARADVFKNPIANKFLRFIGLLPAYRMDIDGIETVGNNADTFNVAEHELLNGRTVVLYPEAGHQDKHWLGNFSFGYTRMAFNAAARDDFKKEIFILPSCNHYEDYFRIRTDLLIKYGTPIPISPFYELYKTKPRTAQREVNKLVREQIYSLMLNIEDHDNYESIDYIRNSYGKRYAEAKGLNPDVLPEKLSSDKLLVSDLEYMAAKDVNCVKEIYRLAQELKKGTLKNNIRDWNFDKKFFLPEIMIKVVCLTALFPLFIFSLMPNLFIFLAPGLLIPKMPDKLFTGSVYYGMSVLITIPLFYTLTFLLTYTLTSVWWIAAVHLACLPLLGLFAWYYRMYYIKLRSEIRFRRLYNNGELHELIKTRNTLFARLNSIMK